MTDAARRHDVLSRVVLAMVIVLTTAILASRLDFVPNWDGRFYADCIVDAALRNLAPSSLRCADHVSHAYMLYAGAVQMLSPGSYPFILIANAGLYLLACLAVHRLASLAFPGRDHDLERAFLTSLVAAQPAVLAAVVQPNIDLPMLPAFLWGCVFVLRRQWIALIAVGIALVATKETGVLLYTTLLVSFVLGAVIPYRRSARRVALTCLRLAPLALPVVLFASYILYRVIVPQGPVIWAPGMSKRGMLLQFVIPHADRRTLNYLVLIFVLGFAWVGTLFVSYDTAVAAYRAWRRTPPRALNGARRRVVHFVAVLGLLTTYALTRFSSYGNTRYLLPIFAIAPLVLYASMVRLAIAKVPRVAILAALVGVTLISSVRTIDPVSRAVFGTFPVGDHHLLRMTRLTGECCGAGRDQLVYNLEFTTLSDLVSDVTASMANDSTTLFVPPVMRWETVGALDSTTRRRTLRRDHRFTPNLFEPDTLSLLDSPPVGAIYLALPNGDVEAGARVLARKYQLGEPRRFWRGRYSLTAYPLTLRSRL